MPIDLRNETSAARAQPRKNMQNKMGAVQSKRRMSNTWKRALQSLVDLFAFLKDWQRQNSTRTTQSARVDAAFNVVANGIEKGTARVGLAYFPFWDTLKAYYTVGYRVINIPVPLKGPLLVDNVA